MSTVKELNIQLENKPGTLAKLCNALASRNVNIVAFQASTDERRSQVHLVVDNSAAAKTVLDAEGLTHTENDVAQVALPSRPGELARVAGRLGEANINIDYAYAGVDPAPTLRCCSSVWRKLAALLNCLTKPLLPPQADRLFHLSITGIEAEAACRRPLASDVCLLPCRSIACLNDCPRQHQLPFLRMREQAPVWPIESTQC